MLGGLPDATAEWRCHPHEGTQLMHMQLGRGTVKKELLISQKYIVSRTLGSFKMQGEKGEYFPFLVLLEQSHKRTLREVLAEAAASLDAFAGKQSPCKQAVGLNLERVNKADKANH